MENTIGTEMAMDTSGTDNPGLKTLVTGLIVLYQFIMISTVVICVIELLLMKLQKRSSNVFLKIVNIILVLLFGLFPAACLADNYKFYSAAEFGAILALFLPSIIIIAKGFTKNEKTRKTINIFLIIVFVIAIVALGCYKTIRFAPSLE